MKRDSIAKAFHHVRNIETHKSKRINLSREIKELKEKNSKLEQEILIKERKVSTLTHQINGHTTQLKRIISQQDQLFPEDLIQRIKRILSPKVKKRT